MLIRFLGWLFWLFNYSLCSTLKYRVNNEPAGQSLFAVWHSGLFSLFFWGTKRKICIIPTNTWRGDSITYLANKYGIKTVRFLEDKSPLERAAVLSDFYNTIVNGYDAAIAVDGPPPPIVSHQAKAGILFLSQKTGVPVVATGVKIKRKITLFWRWDKIEIPLPWSEVELNFGKPYLANENSTAQELGAKINELSGEP